MKRIPVRKALACVIAGGLAVVLVLSGWAESASIWNYEMVYVGRDTVDIHFGLECSGQVKCVLTRNSRLMREWENTGEDIYWSDTSAERINLYAFKKYAWDSENARWQEYPYEEKETTVDTTLAQGTLHNSAEWQKRLGRTYVDWRPENGVYWIQNVVLADGSLYIAPNTQVTFVRDGGPLRVQQGAWLQANSAVFSCEEEATGQGAVYVSEGSTDSPTRFENCRITDVYLELEKQKGLRLAGNQIVKTDAYNSSSMIRISDSSGVVVENNTGNALLSISGENNVVRDNALSSLSATGPALIQGNTCNKLHISSSEKGNATVRGNFVKSLYAYSGAPLIENNAVRGDAEAEFDGKIECYQCVGAMIRGNTVRNFEEIGIEVTGGSANTVEGNLIEEKQRRYETSSAGILLWGTEQNLIKGNNLLGIYGRGIHLYMASKNHMEYNAVNSSTREGIFFENSDTFCELLDEPKGSSDNVIVFNHIWKNLFGIHASPDKGCHRRNGIHDNIIAENGTGVKLGPTNTDNTIYNNVFRNNVKNASDDGEQNRWYHDKVPVNQNIVGGPYLGGNFWSDYAGSDSDGDGLGDTPYSIRTFSGSTETQQDAWPLIDKGYGPPVAQATPSPLAFVQPFGGGPVLRSLTVANTGGSNLDIGQIALSGAGASSFSPGSDTCTGKTLAPQATCLVEVTFSAPDGGLRQANLLLPSNDPVRPVLWIGLNGQRRMEPLPGDINGDGFVNLSDAALALQVLAGRLPAGQALVLAADVNGDGRIALAEVLYALQAASALR